MKTILAVWRLLAPSERRQIAWLFPLIVLMGLMQVAGVASVVPFLGLIADVSRIHRSAILTFLYDHLGFVDDGHFLLFVGGGVLAILTVGNAIAAGTTWALLRFSWLRNHTLAKSLLEGYLRHEYAFFLTKNSTEISRNVLGEVHNVVASVLVQGVQAMARIVVICFLVGALIIVDPFLALSVTVLLGGIYGSVFLALRRRLVQMGTVRVEANGLRYKTAAEMFAGIKEVKLYGLEEAVVDQFDGPSLRFARHMATSAVVGQLPRYALETVAFGGLLLIVLYLLATERDLSQALPLMGLYAFVAYRLLPSLQIVFAAVTAVRFTQPSVELLARELASAPDVAREDHAEATLVCQKSIQLRKLRFSYPGAAQPTLHDLDMEIPAGAWVALVGATGAGKSTIVDIVLGLLQPEDGALTVDGTALDAVSLRRWRRSIGYVPQQIFLADDTVARNICFGLPPEQIDRPRVERAARVAQLHDFIADDLPAGYDTVIGERGVRLSGGQRQRLGIARALYREPQFLVLDEATSALDSETETRFFQALKGELEGRTVLSIAHRLTTTRVCDRIYVIERGAVAAAGTYNELLAESALFRALAGAEPFRTTEAMA